MQIINFSTKELKKHLYREHRDFDGRAQQVSAVQETGSTDEEEAMWQDVDSGHGDEANDAADEMTDEDF